MTFEGCFYFLESRELCEHSAIPGLSQATEHAHTCMYACTRVHVHAAHARTQQTSFTAVAVPLWGAIPRPPLLETPGACLKSRFLGPAYSGHAQGWGAPSCGRDHLRQLPEGAFVRFSLQIDPHHTSRTNQCVCAGVCACPHSLASTYLYLYKMHILNLAHDHLIIFSPMKFRISTENSILRKDRTVIFLGKHRKPGVFVCVCV